MVVFEHGTDILQMSRPVEPPERRQMAVVPEQHAPKDGHSHEQARRLPAGEGARRPAPSPGPEEREGDQTDEGEDEEEGQGGAR
jgi:hypothetical protein